MNKLRKLSDWRFIARFILSRLSVWFSDELYIRLLYRLAFGRKINLVNPQGFNEKLNWLKLNFRNPNFTVMADKFWVKRYVAKIIGEQYVVPCYGKWKSVEDIDFTSLPTQVFLKSTHDSGGGVLVDQGKGVDYKILKKRFNERTLNRKNWYWHLREYPYKHIEPFIIAEAYLDEGTGYEIRDYKFYCFGGIPRYMYITNKGKKIYENFYDMDFLPVDIWHGHERLRPEYEKPAEFEQMKELARVLSCSIDSPFVRVDFFCVNNRVYFGEFTFYDWGGMSPFSDLWEKKLGDMVNLENI